MPARGEPRTEGLRIQSFRAACLPRLIDRKAFHHAIELPERETKAQQREEIDFRIALVTPVRTVDVDDGVAPIMLRIDLQTELAAQLEHAILPFAKPRAAHRDHAAIGRGPVPDASAHAIPCLE